MRRQCLFDPNHMIDDLGFGKHLKNCQSRLKVDWRQCKYFDQHWSLYNHIEFHQKYECTENPLFKTNPKAFKQRRQQEIRKRQFQAKRKKNKNQSLSILSQLNSESSFNNEKSLIINKDLGNRISFGQISMIEGETKNQIPTQNVSGSKQINDHSIFDLENVLDMNDTLNMQKKGNKVSSNTSIINKQKSKQQVLFQIGLQKNKPLWEQPIFSKFESDYKKRWITKKQEQKKEIKMTLNEDEKEKSFQEVEEHQITMQDIQIKYDEVDWS